MGGNSIKKLKSFVVLIVNLEVKLRFKMFY